MNENTKPFRQWVDDQFSLLAATYRRDLATVVNTCREYAEGNIWEPRHTATGIACLPAPPAIGKYPGVVSAEDQAWYKDCKKADWEGMLRDARAAIKELETK